MPVTDTVPVYTHSMISRIMSGDRPEISKTFVPVDDRAVKRDLWVWNKKEHFIVTFKLIIMIIIFFSLNSH